ncbi:endonuclease [Corynebacterium humireducens NBRC 106098 = DSM 45392]|uniref:Endonuclease n=1 Tax=Corynebacterium humireducens NBRC 106098 = DSM 45392 TaxID=1223515 RepID=A0A0B5DAF6_9CORY|nr:Z1 domain-containing protein [Corynebacterium humireducens]AJE32699.1 endonuclease [Corynebacterium humireducens NBRC 106098 = DSM 45392]
MTTRIQEIRAEILNLYDPSNLRLKHGILATLEFNGDLDVSPEELDSFIIDTSDEEIQPLISFIVAAWDADAKNVTPQPESAPKTPERMAWVLDRLGISHLAEAIEKRLPNPEPMVIVEEDFRDWYTPEREKAHSSYWDDYAKMLSRNGWDAVSVDTVSEQARQVMRRIEDPTAEHYSSTRGLVVGYVQSGKTANFTAVAAKAIDAGYRLIIILAGTLDNLREQTQRRLDKELFGKEAVLDGRTVEHMDARELRQESYFVNDEEWDRSGNEPGGVFISHGPNVGDMWFPRIRRLTTSRQDYQGSKSGVNPIEFFVPQPDKPTYHPDNLAAMPCMVAVVKKHSGVLKKLNSNLQQVGNRDSRFKDLPVLIIDDESDQASINTKNNTKVDAKEEKERTAVNGQITQLLQNCPRAQYVGYTATPFANVFVDPSDPEDLYPRDYVLMLNEPPAYRGATWFHDRADFADNPEEATVENSQSKAFIRDLEEADPFGPEEFDEVRSTELAECLDMFVLTGAIKKYREHHSPGLVFKHHTMLVHEGVGNDIHADARFKLDDLWRKRGYNLGRPIPEMRSLFEKDLLPVMRVARYNEGYKVPETYEELMPFILEAYEEIMSDVIGSRTPILQVDTVGNDSPNFEIGRVWKVLVGGAKLSRGYTVEGLTVSYFRRKAGSADTLMQTGRWFGFRKGYQDLVRLYAPPSLVEMFEAAMHDEEVFRDNVKAYAHTGSDNKPLLTPMKLAPMVRQSLPDLSPTAKNKMFNAYMVSSPCAPHPMEFNSLPERNNKEALAENMTTVGLPLLSRLDHEPTELAYFRLEGQRSGSVKPSAGTTTAHIGTIPAPEFLELFAAMQWYGDDKEGNYRADIVAPRIKYLQGLIGTGRHHNPEQSDFAEVAIILPSPQRARGTDAYKNTVTLPGIDFPVPLVKRSRRENRHDITGTDRKYTYILENIASGRPCTEPRDEDLHEFSSMLHYTPNDTPEPFDLDSPIARARGAVLVTVFDDRAPDVIAAMNASGTYVPPAFDKGEIGLALAFNSPHAPLGAAPDSIEWAVRFTAPDGTTPISVETTEE